MKIHFHKKLLKQSQLLHQFSRRYNKNGLLSLITNDISRGILHLIF